MTRKPTTEEVIAVRLNAHNLSQRLDHRHLLDAARACGLQNSPPGSALLSLHARVQDIAPDDVERAVADKSILQTWAMRGAPFFVPTSDAATFTTGVLPTTETAMLHLIAGVEPALARLGIGLSQAVDLCAAHIDAVLTGRALDITELGRALAERITGQLSAERRSIWTSIGPYAPNQSLGEAVVHFCMRILTLQAVVCFAPRVSSKAPFVLVREWLGHPLAATDPAVARAELLRHYLRCYGPSTPAGFGSWLGVRAGDTTAWWDLVRDELTAVAYSGTKWVLPHGPAPTPEGVRLLPPHDPYVRVPDPDTLVDRQYQPRLWKRVGSPGSVLADGRIIGTWRARKSGRTLAVTVESFESLTQAQRQMIHDEAQQIAVLRGATSALLTI